MRTFTTEEFVSGKIPRTEDFPAALERFERQCVLPYLSKEVVGAFSYGSVLRGDSNVLSDIDYLMIVGDLRHRTLVSQTVAQIYRDMNVPVQPRVFLARHALAGFHTVNPSFRQHLELATKNYGFHGKNPLDLLAPNYVSYRNSLVSTMTHYSSKMTNGLIESGTSEEKRVDFLKDVMEKPFHAMRVMIQYYLDSPGFGESGRFDDTKANLIRVYFNLGLAPAFERDIKEINKRARKYLALIENRAANPSIPSDSCISYADTLDSLSDCFRHADHFIQGNLELILQDQ